MINFILHILQECKYIARLIDEGLTKEKLLNDPTLQRAASRSIEIIGETSKNIDNDFRKEHGDIDWKEMAGMRDRLIHNYFGVNYSIVWDLMINKIPPLAQKMQRIIDEGNQKLS